MTSAQPATPVVLSHRQIVTILGGLMAGMLLAALDQTIVSTALPTIVGELGGLDHLSWVVTAYLLTSTATTPLYGKISDLYGRKPIFQAAIGIFLIGSLLAGTSQTMGQLIAWRAIQGIGAGGLMAMAMSIIGDIVSPRERGRYQGYMSGVFALASIAGPLLGGFFVDQISWRWIFYINLPVGIVAMVVTSAVLNLPFRRIPHSVDYLGAALLVGAVTSTLLVAVWGGTQYPWTSPVTLGLAASAVVMFLWFIVQERRASEPILPLRLFNDRTFSVSSGLMFIMGIAMFGSFIFLPVFLQVVTGASATSSGMLMVPMMGGVIVSATITGRMVSRTGRYRFFPIAGTIVITAGLFFFSQMGPDTSRVTSSLYMIIAGMGMGMIMPVATLAVQNAVDHRDLGTATSAVQFFRSMGGAVGTAVFGAVLTSRLAHHMSQLLTTAAVANLDTSQLRGSPVQIRALPPAVREAVIEAFSRSIHTVFLWAVPIAALSFLIAWLLKEIPLRDWAHVGAGPRAALSPDGAGTSAAAAEEQTSRQEAAGFE